jgi:hypothetical protein
MISEVQSQGFRLTQVQLPPWIREHVVARDWMALDQAMSREVRPGGVIFGELLRYRNFSEIEFIISIRSSIREPDDDGIWHDDGSRLLAFSLSLTLDPEAVVGGVLEIRKRSVEHRGSQAVPTQPFGTMIVFATGVMGFEHKINRVIQGERVIIAGWCT